MYVAKVDFAVRFEGADYSFRQDRDRIDDNHPILTQSNTGDLVAQGLVVPIFAHWPVVEQATAAPGEKRRGPGRPRKHPLPA